MRPLRTLGIPLLAIGTLAAAAASSREPAPLRCTLKEGRTLVLLRVERDTTLLFAPGGIPAMSYTTGPQSVGDSLLPTPDTPMPAARVRLLRLDSATRAVFVQAGITDTQPEAFIRAAPYRADCRTIRWTDSVPWVVRGDIGYARAALAAPDQWIGGVPVLTIPDVWNYPYPRRRGLAYGVAAKASLAPADAMYSLHAALEVPLAAPSQGRAIAPDTSGRQRALVWARSHRAAAELEPVRSIVRRAVLDVDRRTLNGTPSRVRGTYRVTMVSDGVEGTWYFRTVDRPAYAWRELDSARTTADLLASPHAAGYVLVGYAAAASHDLLTDPPAGTAIRTAALVWLGVADRPTAAGDAARRVLPGRLEFRLGGAPPLLWDHLDALVPRRSSADSALYARMRITVTRAESQPRLPLTLRLDAAGGVRGDTTLVVGARRIRVRVERIDTLSMRRPF